nr:uncharacterized protein LOC114925757 [Arachis hypogaea]
MAQSKHIDKIFDRHGDETIINNRLRLKTSIDAIRWLAFQACAFRGDDESPGSLNRRNFIELIKLLASCNQNINNVVLENAPGNAQYISLGVQKDILHIFAKKVRTKIREEIGDSKFCIIIDEVRDESKRKQMFVVLKFVDKHGDKVKEVCYVHQFFSKLTLIVNVVTVSPKHHDQLRVAQANNVANLIADDQLMTVLEKSTEEGNFSTRGDTSAAYDAITSFEFVFVLHLMRNILEVNHDLCQALQ